MAARITRSAGPTPDNKRRCGKGGGGAGRAAAVTRHRLPASIGGQTRADFFKSLHESAKSASGELFADFLQTFYADNLL